MQLAEVPLKNAYIGEYTSRLPTAYQEVEYIENSWTQYIDTWYKPSAASTAEIKYNILTRPFWYEEYIFAIWDSWCRWRAWFNAEGGAVTGFGFNYTPNLALNTVIVSSWATTGSYKTSNNSVYLFCQNENGTAYHLRGSMRLYYCKIWTNSVLEREFIPCYRKLDGVIWLYDTVNDVFYTNAWSWTFSKWSDVN